MNTITRKAGFWLILLMLLSWESAQAQLTLSGDARMRPRWDLNDQTGNNKTLSRDLYVMYRARLRVKADIGEGWSFQSMLGHNGVGEYAGKFAKGDLPDILGVEQSNLSNDGARRATVDFMELFINYKGNNQGFKVGLFPIASVGNPVYDLHYYPLRMIDIPYFIFNNDAIYGLSTYKKVGDTQFNLALYIDDDRGGYLESATGVELKDQDDQYSIEFGVQQSFGVTKLEFQSLFTIASDTLPKSNTFSLRANGWKVGGTDLWAQAMYSYQSRDKLGGNEGHFGVPTNKYDAFYLRLGASKKFGSDRFRVWLDLANRVDHFENQDVTHQFAFMWLEYAISLAQTDQGRVVLTPRIRPILHREEGTTLQSRQKIELDLDIFF
jgi:hypothetical protein